MLLSAIASHPVVTSGCNFFSYHLFIIHSFSFWQVWILVCVPSGSLSCTWQPFQRI